MELAFSETSETWQKDVHFPTMFVDKLGFSSPTMLWKNFWFATPAKTKTERGRVASIHGVELTFFTFN